MRTELSDFEKTATREELQQEILTFQNALQRLGRKYENILNDWPHRFKEHHEIKYCSDCQEEHYFNGGECNECGQLDE